MANKYLDILNITANGKNQIGLSNTIKRDYGIPLDFTSVQESYDAAVAYAATSTLAYVGQPISVGDKLYIITEAANGTHTVGTGESAVSYDVYLAEVGSATEGDGVSIDLVDGVLSLHGYAAADDATLPQKQADGSIKWVTVGAIVKGDGNTKTVVKAADDSALIVTPVYNEENDTYTYTLDVVLPNVYTKDESDEKFAEKSSLENYVLKETYNSDKSTTDSALGNRYTKEETDGKFLLKTEAYDDTALKARVGAVETGLENVYTKSETYTKDEVNSAIAGITHFSTQVVESTDEMTSDKVLYLVKVNSVTGADVYNEYLVIGGIPTLIGDTSTDLSNYITNNALNETLAGYYTKTEIEGKGYAVAEEVNNKLATKADASVLVDYAKTADVNTALDLKADASALDNYYTKNEIETKGYAVESSVAERFSAQATEIAKKVGSAEIAHASDVAAESATVTDGKLSIVIDAPTRAETAKMIADSIKDVAGEDSIPAVKADLEAEVSRSTAKDTAHDSAITALQTQVAEAKTRADEGVTNAATAQAAADKNAGDITILSNLVSGTGEGDTNSHAYRIGQLEATDAAHKDEFTTLSGKVDNIIDVRLPGLSQEIAANDAAIKTINNTTIPALQAAIDGKAEKATTLAGYGITDAYTKTEIDGLFENFDQSALETAIANNQKAIEDEAARADAAEKANKALIEKLIGADNNKSAREIATEVLVGALEGANEDFDTLIEMANWLADHSSDAVEMDNRIAANEAILAGFGGEEEPETVKAYVDAAIAAIPAYELPVATLNALGGVKSSEAENKIKVAEDGTMEVNAINVNKLVQTEGEELVLSGGKA